MRFRTAACKPLYRAKLSRLLAVWKERDSINVGGHVGGFHTGETNHNRFQSFIGCIYNAEPTSENAVVFGWVRLDIGGFVCMGLFERLVLVQVDVIKSDSF